MTRIGVTGHRFLAEIDKLIDSIDEALVLIENHFTAPFVVISSLAEGADRLVPYRAFARWEKAQLIAVLPMDIEEYMKDFKTLSSKADFINLIELADDSLQPVKVSNRDDAYRAAGVKVIDACDVLIAIWDGQETQRKGGTAEMVFRSRAQDKPLIWIHAGNRNVETQKPISLGKEQGKITLENIKI